MDPLQLAALKTILSGPKPRVVARYIETAAAASISPSVPKVSGLLCVQIIFNWGGTATPGTPTGFTSITSAAATATFPGIRVAYKFLNGSEARAIASAAASATEMTAISYLIAGCNPAYVPGGAATTRTGSSLVFANVTGVAGDAGRLWIAVGMAVGTATLVKLPPSPPFTWDRLVQLQAANLTFGADANNNIRVVLGTGNGFDMSSSVNAHIALINVRGG